MIFAAKTRQPSGASREKETGIFTRGGRTGSNEIANYELRIMNYELILVTLPRTILHTRQITENTL